MSRTAHESFSVCGNGNWVQNSSGRIKLGCRELQGMEHAEPVRDVKARI